MVHRKLNAILLGSFLLTAACVSGGREPQSAGVTGPGEEELQAPEGILREAARAARERRFEDVRRLLQNFQAEDDESLIWRRLLLGQAQMERGAFERGMRELVANYELLRDQGAQLTSRHRRLAARSLQTLGWWHQERREFAEAFVLHHLQYVYLRTYGSRAEQHQALISLARVSTALRHGLVAEAWLQESLPVAQQIPNDVARSEALSLTWHHLAAQWQNQGRWQEALQANRESLLHSRAYDLATANSAERELWDLVQGAEILAAWAQTQTVQSPPEARTRWDEARKAAREGLVRVEQSRLDPAAKATLSSRLHMICPRPCL